jgi:hypothetical protein
MKIIDENVDITATENRSLSRFWRLIIIGDDKELLQDLERDKQIIFFFEYCFIGSSKN